MSTEHDDMRDDLRDASISPRQQLQDIRSILERMDRKLDDKAAASDVIALELRVRQLEQTGGDRVGEMRERVLQLDNAVDVIGRKLAYATGTLASVVVIVNAATIWFINH